MVNRVSSYFPKVELSHPNRTKYNNRLLNNRAAEMIERVQFKTLNGVLTDNRTPQHNYRLRRVGYELLRDFD